MPFVDDKMLAAGQEVGILAASIEGASYDGYSLLALKLSPFLITKLKWEM